MVREPRARLDAIPNGAELTASRLTALLEFEQARDRLMASLIGHPVPRNPLRDEILRRVALCYFNGRVETVSVYQKACRERGIGSPTTVASMLRRLASVGLLRLDPHPSDRRAVCVHPTRKLIKSYAAGLQVLFKQTSVVLDQTDKRLPLGIEPK